jgi:hypothetical protein
MSQSNQESNRKPPPRRRTAIPLLPFRKDFKFSERSIFSEASSSRSVLAMEDLKTALVFR